MKAFRFGGALIASVVFVACSSGGSGGSKPPPIRDGAFQCPVGEDCTRRPQRPLAQPTAPVRQETVQPAQVTQITTGSPETTAVTTSTLSESGISGTPNGGYHSEPIVNIPQVDQSRGLQAQVPLPRNETGAATEGRVFTDTIDDPALYFLRVMANNVPKDILEASHKFAEGIEAVEVSLDANGSDTAIISFRDGDRDVVVRLVGPTHPEKRNNVTFLVAELSQQEQAASTGAPYDGKISATATCIDAGNSCQHQILTIRELKRGPKGLEPCKIAYVIARSFDAHIRLAAIDTVRPESQPNANYAKVMTYLNNTVKCSNARRGEGPWTLCKPPASSTIGLASWSVAFGASAFDLTLEEDAGTNQPIVDVTRLSGLLTSPGGNVESGPSTRRLRVEGGQKNINYGNDRTLYQLKERTGKYVSAIQFAQLTKNNGRGRLSINLNFGYNASAEFDVFPLAFPTMTMEQLKNLVQPDQAQAPAAAPAPAHQSANQCERFFSDPKKYVRAQGNCCDDLEHLSKARVNICTQGS